MKVKGVDFKTDVKDVICGSCVLLSEKVLLFEVLVKKFDSRCHNLRVKVQKFLDYTSSSAEEMFNDARTRPTKWVGKYEISNINKQEFIFAKLIQEFYCVFLNL